MAIAKKCIQIIEAPHGSGLKFSLQNLIRQSPNIKLVYVDCLQAPSMRNVLLTLLKEGSNIRFSNLNYFNVILSDLLMVVRDRIKTDLRDSNVLVVIDHIDILKANQLVCLTRLVSFHKPPCAIVLRSTSEHRILLSEKNGLLHDNLYLCLTTQNNIAVDNCSKEEMIIFIRDINQIQDAEFVKDLSKHRWGFSKTLIFITRYKAKGGK